MRSISSRWPTRTPLKDHIRTSSLVTSVSRAGFDKMKSKGRAFEPFTSATRMAKAPSSFKADAVIDATGTWLSPNPAGADGLPAIGERETQQRIAYGMPDVLGRERGRYAGRTVAVLGAGHSAIGTLIDLVQLKKEAPGTEVIWLLRGDKPEKAFGGGANDKLAARGELGAAFAELVMDGSSASRPASASPTSAATATSCASAPDRRAAAASLRDELVVATGFRPDFDFLRELRLSLDPAVECPPALAPLIDPNEHSCGTVRPHGARELAHPEPGFYFAGMKSYGRAPTFLMLTGYEQVRSIVAEIAGDHEAARGRARAAGNRRLLGPRSGDQSRQGGSECGGCCGGPAPEPTTAETPSGCCVADVKAEQEGKKGCGC